MRIVLVRHPQPEVAPGICYGRTDLPVAAGLLQASAAQLRPWLQQDTVLHTSPLRRCAELAALLSPEPLADPRLMEMDFGAWEMRAWDHIPRAEIDAWAADLVHYRPGGGESVVQMAQRVAEFYADLQRQQQDALLICHAGAMRLLAARHAGLPPPDMALQAAQTPHKIAYGQTLILD
ncbi:alpha-ribazole phosphatase family protein [Oxalobacteraceae bacterium A2-2]